MKLLKDSIFHLISRGYVTLQLPFGQEYYDGSQMDYEDIPDEWLCRLKNNRPCVGKESGYIYLTSKGWEENKDKFKTAFLNSKNKRETWKDVENYVKEHFEHLEKNKQKLIRELKTKLDQAINFTV